MGAQLRLPSLSPQPCTYYPRHTAHYSCGPHDYFDYRLGGDYYYYYYGDDDCYYGAHPSTATICINDTCTSRICVAVVVSLVLRVALMKRLAALCDERCCGVSCGHTVRRADVWEQ